MSSTANIKIKNSTCKTIKTDVTRDYWVEKDGKTINNQTIPAGEEKTFEVIAKTAHHGELDINLVDESELPIGQFKIKSIKDPHKNKALETTSYRDCVCMSTEGYRHSEGNKGIRRINLDVDNQKSLTSCWDFIYASQINVINSKIDSIFKPISFEEFTISSFEFLDNCSEKQNIAKVKIYVEGRIQRLVRVKGYSVLTIDLNKIQGFIKKDEVDSYRCEFKFSDNFALEADLANIETPLPLELIREMGKDAELIFLGTINNAFQSIGVITFPFSFGLPFSIDETIVKLAFVSHSSESEKSFLAVMAKNKDEGIYCLSENFIANEDNTALVFSNALIMNFVKKILTKELKANNLYAGDDFLKLDFESYPIKLESIRDSEKSHQKCNVQVKIAKGGLTSQFAGYGTSDLKIKVDIKYSTLVKITSHTFPASLCIRFSAQDEKLKLRFTNEIGDCNLLHADAIVCPKVRDGVKDAIKKFKKRFGDDLLISIPRMSVNHVDAPSYIHISGKRASLVFQK